MSLEVYLKNNRIKAKRMSLEVYLKNNRIKAKQERIHSDFVETICHNLDKIGIESPYKIFKEVRLRDFKKKKGDVGETEPKNPRLINKDFYRQSDLIIFNSELYIIEVKVIRSSNHERKEGDNIRAIRKQLSAGYSFFKKNFKTNPVLIGVYKRLNSSNFHFYYQNPDGSIPSNSEISQISCK